MASGGDVMMPSASGDKPNPPAIAAPTVHCNNCLRQSVAYESDGFVTEWPFCENKYRGVTNR